MLPIDTSTYSFDPLFINAAMGALINMAKHSTHPALRWINDATPWITRIVHSLIAALSAAGMTLSYATADDGSMSITLAGITFAGVGTFIFTALKNFMTQAGTSGMLDMMRWMREFSPTLIEIQRQMRQKQEREKEKEPEKEKE